MKKVFAILMAAAVTVSMVVAEDSGAQAYPAKSSKSDFAVSLGVSGLFTADFTNWDLTSTAAGLGMDRDMMDTMAFAGGGSIFLDATYVLLNVGFTAGRSHTMNEDIRYAAGYYPTDLMALHFGILGKYPFALGERFVLSPMLGLEYELVLSAKQDGSEMRYAISNGTQNAKAIDALSSLWFNIGVAADFFLTDSLFLRCEYLHGMRLNNKEEAYLLYKDSDLYKLALGHGLDLKAGLGIRF
ncbi:hypothetical protein K7I13_10295 [Brucepastera parasyntrophica]|uniref:hypothetical protein n=1 Tax=Brucepastera parasyntrophica TaxID=2880008 RepID=UPI00210AEBA0|nr:hypothetical protein [Brucepastera parasyntrophica]ULQ58912.1 hypothetical protein K7I13_10295 [Brucepastera parasyntrophica]